MGPALGRPIAADSVVTHRDGPADLKARRRRTTWCADPFPSNGGSTVSSVRSTAGAFAVPPTTTSSTRPAKSRRTTRRQERRRSCSTPPFRSSRSRSSWSAAMPSSFAASATQRRIHQSLIAIATPRPWRSRYILLRDGLGHHRGARPGRHAGLRYPLPARQPGDRHGHQGLRQARGRGRRPVRCWSSTNATTTTWSACVIQKGLRSVREGAEAADDKVNRRHLLPPREAADVALLVRTTPPRSVAIDISAGPPTRSKNQLVQELNINANSALDHYLRRRRRPCPLVDNGYGIDETYVNVPEGSSRLRASAHRATDRQPDHRDQQERRRPRIVHNHQPISPMNTRSTTCTTYLYARRLQHQRRPTCTTSDRNETQAPDDAAERPARRGDRRRSRATPTNASSFMGIAEDERLMAGLHARGLVGRFFAHRGRHGIVDFERPGGAQAGRAAMELNAHLDDELLPDQQAASFARLRRVHRRRPAIVSFDRAELHAGQQRRQRAGSAATSRTTARLGQIAGRHRLPGRHRYPPWTMADKGEEMAGLRRGRRRLHRQQRPDRRQSAGLEPRRPAP